MQCETDKRLEKLLHTRKTISDNIASEKDLIAKKGKRWVDLELMLGGTVGLVAWICFDVETYLLKHLLVFLFAIILITTLYIFRVSKSFTHLEKNLLDKIDSKIETLKKTNQ